MVNVENTTPFKLREEILSKFVFLFDENDIAKDLAIILAILSIFSIYVLKVHKNNF